MKVVSPLPPSWCPSLVASPGTTAFLQIEGPTQALIYAELLALPLLGDHLRHRGRYHVTFQVSGFHRGWHGPGLQYAFA